MSEPIHDNTARTTATSQAEGRLKVGFNRSDTERKKRHKAIYGDLKTFSKKRKYLKKRLSEYNVN